MARLLERTATSVPTQVWRVVIVLAVLSVAVLLAAHDAIWSVVVALVLGAFAMFVLRRAAPRGGKAGLLAVFAAVVLVLFGGTQAARTGWLDLVGRESVATVTHVSSHCTGNHTCHPVEDYATVLPDGDDVPGSLHGYRPGALHVGSAVTVRYDPTGIVLAPVSASGTAHDGDVLLGSLLVGAGLLLAAGLAAGLRQRSNL